MNNKHVCDYNLTSGSPPIQVEAGGFEDERSNKEVTTGWVVTLLLCSDDPSLVSLYIYPCSAKGGEGSGGELELGSQVETETSSQLSLPSPDPVANLWRFNDSPPFSRSSSLR